MGSHSKQASLVFDRLRGWIFQTHLQHPTHKNKEGETKMQTNAADRKQYLTENTFSV